ncbi:hypothetical protein LTR37_019465 [Vermiconidia calcicola]|uniref:Uncharacterized protein n=1 Tax=Vermiconidia calcicola TaxID=1690605 RepID=A0ACC3ME34_9PEZI|nr:hypothetical protein LTR37_019465 [Vermiconidia calcicola]
MNPSNDTPGNLAPSVEVFECSDFGDSGYFEATDANGQTHYCYTFSTDAEEGFCTYHFVCHSECLSILQRALETYIPRQTKPSLENVYEALCATLSDAGGYTGLPLEHEYFGATDFWAQDWEAEKGWEHLVFNPKDLRNVTQYIISHLRPAAPEQQRNGLPTSADESNKQSPKHLTDGGGLQGLPPETLSLIATKLSMEDTFALRLASRELAVRVPLTQGFWRRHLIAGDLFGLDNLDTDMLEKTEKGLDWKRLVRTLSRYESFHGPEEQGPEEWGSSEHLGEMHDAPLGLKNRMRIWKVARALLTSIDNTS